MKIIIIDSEHKKTYCKTMLEEMPVDGSKTIVFKTTDMSSTSKQRRLSWLWATEVANSGLGQDDTKEDVHTRAKMMFAHPILMLEDDVYPILYGAFKESVKAHGNYAKYMKVFASQYISTERFTRKQRAEFLTDFQNYWTGKGVELTDPSLQGLDQFLGYKTKLKKGGL